MEKEKPMTPREVHVVPLGMLARSDPPGTR